VPSGMDNGGRLSHGAEVSELLQIMRSSGVIVGEHAERALLDLASLIEHWNKHINLVSRRDIGRLVGYHFFDSASLLPVLRPGRDIRVLDVGGGNGLPGLVLSAICPGISLLICDGRSKRREFLEQACAAVGPDNGFHIGSVNERQFRSMHAESFDLIVARAVTALGLLLKWCLPLLKAGGVLAAYKGSRCAAEVRAAGKQFFAGGGDGLAVVRSPWEKRCNPLRKFAIALKRAS